MFSERIRTIAQSLRFRLTAWNTAAVMLTAIGALVGVHEGMRYTLLHEVDSNLGEDLVEVRLAVEQNYPDFKSLFEELDRKAEGHVQHGWFVELWDETGRKLWSSRNSPSEPSEIAPSLIDSPDTYGGRRIAESTISTPRAPRLRVRVGVRLDQFNADLEKVTRIIVLAGAALLVVAPLSGYWLAGRATRPLAEMFQTAAGLHPDNMGERLPVRQTGDELDRLSVTINGLLDRLADYLHRKRDFIANAAHELRSPLAAIQTSVDVALTSDRTITEYHELLEDVRSECGDLVSLVNQLLFLAQSDAGNLEPGTEVVRLDRIIAQSIEMFRGHAELRDVDLRPTSAPEISIVGSASHFRQIVNNLIDNALKFTHAGGVVSVELRLESSSGDVLMEVRDTGAGIAPADLPFVFDRFYRADKSRRRDAADAGTGLGLSICQSIAHAYQGAISVESKLGEGSSFLVRLPKGLIVGARAPAAEDERVSA